LTFAFFSFAEFMTAKRFFLTGGALANLTLSAIEHGGDTPSP
jgi:hypothetical protein